MNENSSNQREKISSLQQCVAVTRLILEDNNNDNDNNNTNKNATDLKDVQIWTTRFSPPVIPRDIARGIWKRGLESDPPVLKLINILDLDKVPLWILFGSGGVDDNYKSPLIYQIYTNDQETKTMFERVFSINCQQDKHDRLNSRKGEEDTNKNEKGSGMVGLLLQLLEPEELEQEDDASLLSTPGSTETNGNKIIRHESSPPKFLIMFQEKSSKLESYNSDNETLSSSSTYYIKHINLNLVNEILSTTSKNNSIPTSDDQEQFVAKRLDFGTTTSQNSHSNALLSSSIEKTIPLQSPSRNHDISCTNSTTTNNNTQTKLPDASSFITNPSFQSNSSSNETNKKENPFKSAPIISPSSPFSSLASSSSLSSSPSISNRASKISSNKLLLSHQKRTSLSSSSLSSSSAIKRKPSNSNINDLYKRPTTLVQPKQSMESVIDVHQKQALQHLIHATLRLRGITPPTRISSSSSLSFSSLPGSPGSTPGSPRSTSTNNNNTTQKEERDEYKELFVNTFRAAQYAIYQKTVHSRNQHDNSKNNKNKAGLGMMEMQDIVDKLLSIFLPE